MTMIAAPAFPTMHSSCSKAHGSAKPTAAPRPGSTVTK
jgi:hypothetical protein